MTKHEAFLILSAVYEASIETCKEQEIQDKEVGKYHEALRMAIDSLLQEPCKQCGTEFRCKDIDEGAIRKVYGETE